mgnify:FL=1
MTDSISLVNLLEVVVVSVLVGVGAVWFLLRSAKAEPAKNPEPKALPDQDAVFDNAPIPAWVEALNGDVLSSNASYDQLQNQLPGAVKLFQHPPDITLTCGKPARYTTSLNVDGSAHPLWYEVTLKPLKEIGRASCRERV